MSKGGKINFLASGLKAHNMDKQPDSFMLFMFSLLLDASLNSKKDRELAIRLVFGEGKVDNDTVKYNMKNNLFLANTMEQGERQIKTGVKFLKKLTYRGSTRTVGFAYDLKLIECHQRLFDQALKCNQMFIMKFVYLLDRISKLCEAIMNLLPN